MSDCLCQKQNLCRYGCRNPSSPSWLLAERFEGRLLEDGRDPGDALGRQVRQDVYNAQSFL